jgi:hypothetical protein
MVFFASADRASSIRYSLSRSWAGRYIPNLSALMSNKTENSIALLEYSSDFGRHRTATGIRRHLRISCELAGLEVNQLFSGSSNLVNLSKVRQLARTVEAVYEKVLEFYEQRSSHRDSIQENSNPISYWIPEVEALSSELQPVLSEMQARHLADEDPRTIGFVTTQIHYSTRAILKRLAPVERTLLNAYFQLAEEQVCIPWQEVCALAMRYEQTAPEILLLESLFPHSDEIAIAVVQKLRSQFPQFRSRNGSWQDAQILASMLRDLNMFQVYLWLCLLHQDLSAITVRLLPLCLVVFPTVNVPWEFVDQTVRTLVAELRSRMTEPQWYLVQPYTAGLIEMFSIENN